MGRALYDFHSNRTDEISFSTGDMMVSHSSTYVRNVVYWIVFFQILAPQEHQPRVRGWLLAAKGDKVGYVNTFVIAQIY